MSLKLIRIPFGTFKPRQWLYHNQVGTWILECTIRNWTTENQISPCLDLLDSVKLSNILVIFSFKIQIQDNNHQEAQGHWIFQMISSSFPYSWYNVIHVIKKIYFIINSKESKRDLYTMDYISQSPIHCSKVNIKCVLNCNKFPVKQANGYMSKTTCS